MWVVGYGSLVFRPGFAYVERRRAFVRGWSRRFWQGSPDHRGVPEAPGRVVTLVADAEAACGGCAYRIAPEAAAEIFAQLDQREIAGFDRHVLPLFDPLDGAPFAEGTTWIAGQSNAHFLGELDEEAIAVVVRERRGPSGSNADYVLRLREALASLAIDDPHVEAIARHLSR